MYVQCSYTNFLCLLLVDSLDTDLKVIIQLQLSGLQCSDINKVSVFTLKLRTLRIRKTQLT